MEEVEIETEIVFQNVSAIALSDRVQVEYIFAVAVVQQSQFDPGSKHLVLDVEEKLSGSIWHGDFTAKYIEDITNKTGSFKKFNVFANMVISAVKAQGDAQNSSWQSNSLGKLVTLNLLTQQDLLALKQKQGLDAKSQSSAQS